MIIGLTGRSAAGKGTVAECLKKKGYIFHSCSDILRLELKKRNINEDLPNLIDIGNVLRQEEGAGVLGKRILQLIQDNNEEKSLVDSIRNPEEIKELKIAGSNFVLLAIDAPLEVRYERVKNRGRAGSDISFEEFKKCDEQEFKSDNPKSQQILACMNLADYKINNEGTLEELNTKIDNILEKINE